MRLGFHNHAGELAVLDDGRSLLDRLVDDADTRLFLELDLGWVWYADVEPMALLERVGRRAPLVHVKDMRKEDGPVYVPLGTGLVDYRRLGEVASQAGVEWLIVEQDEVEGPSFDAVEDLDRGAARSAGGDAVVNGPARVGVVGCGVISREYAANAPAFGAFEIVACTDLDEARRTSLADEYRLAAMEPDELLSSPSIDIVLNLTPPAAHRDVTRLALEQGKHVYSEKPLAMVAPDAADLLAAADARGLQIGCAPDIFLGGAYQEARSLIDRGAIGNPLAVSATMLAGGQETWHPDPDIFFRDGAGPLLDMGPYYLSAIVALLGPIRRVAGLAATLVEERSIELGPRTGETFRAETPTHTAAVVHLASGAVATLVASFEAPRHYASTVLVLGSEGTLSLPGSEHVRGQGEHPSGEGRLGRRRLSIGRCARSERHRASRSRRGDRGRSPAACVRGTRASHRRRRPLDSASASNGSAVDVGSTVGRPEPLPTDVPVTAAESAQ